MKTIYKIGIGSVVALAAANKLGLGARLAKAGDAEVHGSEWADAKFRERTGHAARKPCCAAGCTCRQCQG